MDEERYLQMPAEWGGIVPSEVFVREAIRIVEEGEKQGLILRVMGGVGVKLHSPESEDLMKRLGRLGPSAQEFTDLDFMAYRRQRDKMKLLFERLGYHKRRATLSSAASERQIYFHPNGWFFVDVFYDNLRVANHPLDFRGRLELDKPMVSPTDLLLEKLQIVNFSEKDLKDTLALLNAHRVEECDETEALSATYIASLLCKDWGFWYTVTININGVKDRVSTMNVLTKDERQRIVSRIEKILDHVQKKPKTNRWKLRSIIGARKTWYKPVETTETVGEFHMWRLKEEARK